MATVTVNDRALRVRFSRWERLALWRRGVTVPLAAVRGVERITQPLPHTRGGRCGFLVSGVVKVGIWGFGTGRRQLVCLRRGVPALRITIDRESAGGRLDELLIGTHDADRLVPAIASGR